MQRDVSAELEVQITAPTTLEFQIAVAREPGLDVSETLRFRLDGEDVPFTERVADHGSRIQMFDAAPGTLTVHYSASVTGHAEPIPVDDLDMSRYLRPSRYAETDKLFGFAAKEFDDTGDAMETVNQVSSWVGSRMEYVPGASTGTDGAVDTLLAGQGVCRDYAHLVVALLRALNVPARLVAVYAPGCDPMDFHAVAEALVDGVWRVVDATCLAPRQTMLRIATGRDAADAAFLDNHGGEIVLSSCVVTAVVDELPEDSIDDVVSLG